MAALDLALPAQRPAYSAVRPGPFISGTTHRVLQLGQRPVVGEASDGEADAEAGAGRAASGGAGPGEAPAKRARKDGGSGGGSGLADLLAAGYLKPGRNKVAVAYKGERVTATLTKDGVIIWQGKRYVSPTAFTVAVKRQAPAGRQGNDGWRSVLYEGAPLERVRKAYASQFAPAADDFDEDDLLPLPAEDGAAAAPAAAAAAAPAAETAGADAPATDQWVQCDRCDTWRVVPDSAWPALEAEESESWSCADATWNLSLMPPHTPACS